MKIFGKDIEIKLFKPLDKEKILHGRLMKFDRDTITIEVDSKEKIIDRKQIAQIKLRYEW